MTDAMQITVNKAMANRIEDSNSVRSFARPELFRTWMPWVEALIVKESKAKRAALEHQNSP
ncbi:hypothetical protein NBRC116584_31620 [Hydrogenophaga sp. 5NK40-0174]